MLLVPAREQVGAVVFIVGTAGITNTAALLKGADGFDVQVPFPEVTV